MTWRAALIDSCGDSALAMRPVVDAVAFTSDGQSVERCATVVDPTGHGTRIVQLWMAGEAAFELLLGQVFVGRTPAGAAAVAAAIDWAVDAHADLIHLSLGLATAREVLAAAVRRAVGAGCIMVASMPARGAMVYPAGYAGVIRATGDARCAAGELSFLGPWFFGGCPRLETGATPAAGASIGAAWVTRQILRGPREEASAVVAALERSACHVGAERRGQPPEREGRTPEG